MAFSNLDNPLRDSKASLLRPAEETIVTGPAESSVRERSFRHLFDSDSSRSDAQHAAFDQADQQGSSGVEA